MLRTVNLSPLFQRAYTDGQDTFRITLTASGAVNMPNEVFLCLRLPYAVGQTDFTDRFETVCSGTDLDAVPVGNPTLGDDPLFSRQATIDLRFRSRAQALDAYNAIRQAVADLIASLTRNDDLVAMPTITIGG